MNTDNQNRFRTMARMNKETFLKLLDLLHNTGELWSSRHSEAGEELIYLLSDRTSTTNAISVPN